MELDEIPQLPDINLDCFTDADEKLTFEKLYASRRKLILYENERGTFNFCFEGLDEVFYAGIVAFLASNMPHCENVFEFLKLCWEGTRMALQCNKKGFENAVRIEKYLKNDGKRIKEF